MADTYIDYWECLEYGRYLIRRLQALRGTTELVAIEELIARLELALALVQAELEKAGMTRSDVRSGRSDIQDAVTTARTTRERFYYHLCSLPEEPRFDFAAFFPKGTLGDVSRMKPDDVLSTVNEVLLGFAAPANVSLASSAEWKEALSQARDALDAALAGKDGAKVHASGATAGLAAARKGFLTVYNGVAKRLVRGVLEDLGRSKEYRQFFRDLQVNESRSPGAPDQDTSAEPPGSDAPTDKSAAQAMA